MSTARPQSITLVTTSASVSPAQAQAIAAALNTQLGRDFCPAWGLDAIPCVFQADPLQALPAGSWLLSITDTVTQPQDLASHWDELGLPVASVQVPVILQNGGGVLTGSDSVASAASHEALEMAADPAVNLWFPTARIPKIALECCDPAQGDTYDIDGVDVSDFVLPAWFDLASSGPFDQLRLCTAAQQVRPGGYSILQAPDGTTSDVFAERRPAAHHLDFSHRRWIRRQR